MMLVVGIFVGPQFTRNFKLGTLACCLGLLLGWLLVHRYRAAWQPKFAQVLREQGRAIDDLSPRRARWFVFAAAAAGLFAELMLVRWHGSTFQVFGFFKNVSLLACCLGLGMGYALRPDRPCFAPLIVPALSAQFAVLHLLRLTELQFRLNNPIRENLTMGLADAEGLSARLVVFGFLLTVFVLTTYTTIPLGQLAGRAMAKQEKLEAYGWNLGGSLLGVLAFTALAFLWAPPATWLMISAAILLPLLDDRKAVLWGVVSLGAAVCVLVHPFRLVERDIYSPYQRLTVRDDTTRGVVIRVNDFFFQYAFDLSPKSVIDHPWLKSEADFYEIPYALLSHPRRAMVVGSGTGNDVAAALRMGTEFVDAVEIDPVILDLGYALHPEHPYQRRNVETWNSDARNFLRETPFVYDLIVFGLLDSHASLSGLTSVRLDSYIYTVEALRQARDRLSDRGLLVLNFSIMAVPQSKKILEMIEIAFDGQMPRVFATPGRGRLTFLAGPGLSAATIPTSLAARDVTTAIRSIDARVDPSTDDWPFLYMLRRQYPLSYLVMNGLLLLAGSGILLASGGRKGTGWFDPTFFLLGAGFMLVEVKAITELGLVFGSTWIVLTAVILSVLGMAYLANWLVRLRAAPGPRLAVGLLLFSLVLGWTLPSSLAASLSPSLSKIAVSTVLVLPLLFSGLLFSGILAGRGTVQAAMSSNLLGALVGGLLEYNALYLGYGSLYVLAAGMYLVAGLLVMRRGSRAGVNDLG